jgi:hypothetical protein
LAAGGTLRLSLPTGFAPVAGQSFNLLDFGSVAGSFAALDLPALNGLFWDASQLYSTGVLSVAAPLAADFDLDGDVDATDLATWKAGFGLTAAQRGQGDANGDNLVNGADYLLLQRQLGSNFHAPSGEIRAVPEPEGALLAMVAAAAFKRRRR